MSNENDSWEAGESFNRREIETSDKWEPNEEDVPTLGLPREEPWIESKSPDSNTVYAVHGENDECWMTHSEDDLMWTEPAETKQCVGCQRPTPLSAIRMDRGEPHCPACRSWRHR